MIIRMDNEFIYIDVIVNFFRLAIKGHQSARFIIK